MERTLVLLKPDCVQRRLSGRVLARFEDKGLNLVAMKLMRIAPELARRHYAEHVQKAWYPGLEAFITGGPVVAMILEGPEAVRVVRGHGWGNQRAECACGHGAWRLQLQPADEPGACLGQPGIGAPRDRHFLHPGRYWSSRSRRSARGSWRRMRPNAAAASSSAFRRFLGAQAEPALRHVSASASRRNYKLNRPAGVSARSWSIISRVAASTASCHRDAPNRSA